MTKASAPKPPENNVAPLPPPPTRSDAKTSELASEQLRKFSSSKSRGRASTFLTGGGVTQGTSASRFLGGN